jgi:hypothetical protein
MFQQFCYVWREMLSHKSELGAKLIQAGNKVAHHIHD